MNKQPFFSIIIPTYNRPEDLYRAIKSVLVQDFKDYEIVVSDNSTNNLSKRMVDNYNDKRIRYLKNEINIGFTRNLYKAIKSANGEYIFMLGDDDMILKKNTLLSLCKLIQKSKVGLIRLKIIYHNNFKTLYSPYLTYKNNFDIKVGKSSIEIYHFLQSVAYTIISGLVFKNDKKISIPLIEKSRNPNLEMSDFWLKFIFPPVKKHGGYFLKDYFVVNTPVYRKVTTTELYSPQMGRFPAENIWDLVFENLTHEEQIKWVKEETEKMTLMLPSIKYYSNRRDLIFYIKRMLELNSNLYINPLFYLSSFIAFFIPNFLWATIRKIIFRLSVIKERKIINYFDELKYKFSLKD